MIELLVAVLGALAGWLLWDRARVKGYAQAQAEQAGRTQIVTEALRKKDAKIQAGVALAQAQNTHQLDEDLAQPPELTDLFREAKGVRAKLEARR